MPRGGFASASIVVEPAAANTPATLNQIFGVNIYRPLKPRISPRTHDTLSQSGPALPFGICQNKQQTL
jgi:hypothetical protein